MNCYNRKSFKRTINSEEHEPEDLDAESPNAVHQQNNRIYFYAEVTQESVLKLTQLVKKLENELLKIQIDLDLKKPPKIYIYIHSYGGDVYSGLSCMNAISNIKVPVVTIVDGYVASAATFILLAGHKRRMRQYSHVLIHQLRGESWGKYEDLKDEFTNTENLMKTIKSIYLEKSSIPEKKLNRILKKEVNLNSNECIEYELVHRIIE
jgi:ATP-dependent Clp endopeptidase proteolytic subunit ClpP